MNFTKPQIRRAVQIILTIQLAIIFSMLTGCIVAVIQPSIAPAGEIIVAQIQMDSEPFRGGPLPLYVGVRLPSDWNVIGNPVYVGGPTGTLTYSPSLVSNLNTEFGVISDTVWWAGDGPGGDWENRRIVTAIITMEINVAATGTYQLDYVAGTFSPNTNDIDWSAVVSKSLTIGIPINIYLPVIVK